MGNMKKKKKKKERACAKDQNKEEAESLFTDQVVEHPALEKKEVRVIEPQIQGSGEKEKLTSGAQQSKEKSKERKSLNAKVRKTADTNCNGIEDPTRLKIDKGEGLLG